MKKKDKALAKAEQVDRKRIPNEPGYVDVEVKMDGRITVFKIPLDEMKAMLTEWHKKPYPNWILGGIDNPIEKAIQAATGSALTPGERLKHFRKQKGLTQAELARRAGTGQTEVSCAESGTRPLGRELAERLAKALEVDYRILL